MNPIVKSSVRTLLVCATTALPLAAHAALWRSMPQWWSETGALLTEPPPIEALG